jgi:ABC-type glycerol-3-phosphate transport system substrate-binding protein
MGILNRELVEVTFVEWIDAFKKIQYMKVDDSDSPDILQVGKTWIPYFVDRKKFLNLTNIGFPPFTSPKNTSPYSLNYFYDPVLLYFRKDFIRREDILTKISFLNTCQRLKYIHKTKHVVGMIAHQEWYLLHTFFSFLWGTGGRIFVDYFSHKLNYDDHFIDTIEFYEMLLREYGNPSEQLGLSPILYPNMRNIFANRDDFFFFIGGVWMVRDLQKIYGNSWGDIFGVTALPTTNGTNHPVFIGGSDLCVLNKKEIKNKHAIKRCLEKLIEPSNQLKFCLDAAVIPANIQARRKWAVVLDETYQTEFNIFLERIISNGCIYPANSNWDEVGSGILFALNEIFNNLFGGFGSDYSEPDLKRNMILKTLNKNQIEPKYIVDVAFSFAGEDRNITRELVKSLKNNKVKFFFDENETSRLVGLNLNKEFQKIFGGRSRFVVVMISRHYPIKDWTQFEFEIIKDEAKRRSKTYVIPCIIEKVPIPGMPRNISSIDLRKQSINGATKIIMDKLTGGSYP